jgi:hypothetical protein
MLFDILTRFSKYTPPLPRRGEDCGEGALFSIFPHPDLLPFQEEGTVM